MGTCSECGTEANFLYGGRCKRCSTLHKAAQKGDSDAAAELAARRGIPEEIERVVATETHVEGVTERLGVVTGQCALGMNIFRDFTAEVRDVVGGRSGAYQRAITEAKDTVIREMQREAAELGADAVIAVDIDMSEITGGGGLFGGKGMIAMGTVT